MLLTTARGRGRCQLGVGILMILLVAMLVISVFLRLLKSADEIVSMNSIEKTVAIVENARKKGQAVEEGRKILIDCGANVASTVELFRTTYPDADSYQIYSFELDDRLAPYFASYAKHELLCPAAVSDTDGTILAYAESPWFPGKGVSHGLDLQWGGGAIFAYKEEKEAKEGGYRQLNYRKDVLSIDLANWMKKNLKEKDYVIFKLDVEGAEYRILRKILDENVFRLVDKFYGEFHAWAPIPENEAFKKKIHEDLATQKVKMLDWAGEIESYTDIMELQNIGATKGAGVPGATYAKCQTNSSKRLPVSVGIAIGNNFRLADRIVETVLKFKRMKKEKGEVDPPITLYVYADFVKQHAETVWRWSKHVEIASRGERHFLPGVFDQIGSNIRRKSLIHARRTFLRFGVQTTSYLSQLVESSSSAPSQAEAEYTNLLKRLGLHLIKPTARYPPSNLSALGQDYFRVQSVERNPKAMRYIHGVLKDTGGILVLDSDFDDSFQISVFLLDYLTDYEKSNTIFELVSLSKCIN